MPQLTSRPGTTRVNDIIDELVPCLLLKEAPRDHSRPNSSRANLPKRKSLGSARAQAAMLSYFEYLEAKAKEKYREKLSCVGLSIQDDPYLPTSDARFV